MKIIRAIIASACLMFLCSCATRDSVRPSLPAETAFNKDAGRGQWIYVMLHLENGKELLFIADTGTTGAVLDKSLEPILGKRLGTRKANYPFYGKVTANVYKAPKLYLGSTCLATGNRILTDDLSRLSSDRPIMGILGMDCLRHYCIQLDFTASKIRFLDPDHSENENLGEKFLLTYTYFDGLTLIHMNLFGQSNTYLVDTGDTGDDVALKPKLFEQELRKSQEQTSSQFIFSRQIKTPAGVLVHEVFFPGIVFNGEDCTNFILGDSPGRNLLGLRFLSRHLTTLNFPKRTMYLQRSNVESFADKDNITNFLGNTLDYIFVPEAVKFLSHLKEQGQLPGWLKDERGEVSIFWTQGEDSPEVCPISRTFIATKKGDVSKYHYVVVQTSKNSALKLQKAWRTDASGHILNEYPVP
jgi:hypothetical protein